MSRFLREIRHLLQSNELMKIRTSAAQSVLDEVLMANPRSNCPATNVASHLPGSKVQRRLVCVVDQLSRNRRTYQKFQILKQVTTRCCHVCEKNIYILQYFQHQGG